MYCFPSSNFFQRRQICQVNIYIKPHIITTVRLKFLSRKHVYFIWMSLKNRLKATETVSQGRDPGLTWYSSHLPQMTLVSFCGCLTGCKSKHTCFLFCIKHSNSCCLTTPTSRRQHGFPKEGSRGSGVTSNCKISAFPFTDYATLNKLLNLHEPQFPHLQNGKNYRDVVRIK